MEQGFLPYGRHWIDEDDVAAVVEVLRGERLTQGPKIEEFEETVARRVGARHAVACSSGTAALHLAMLAAGAAPGDEVVCPATTFVATANCALYVGAEPRFCDVDYATVCATPQTLEPALTARTRVVLPVHFAGLPCDVPAITQTVRARCPRALIVEDACHALGARHADGTPVGNLRWSDMAVFSFHPVKHAAAGEGGMVVTDRDDLARRLRLFRNHGIARDPESLAKPGEGPWYYEMRALGYNYRLPDLNCALGISQMKKLDAFLERRREIAARYNAAFADLDGVDLPLAGAVAGNEPGPGARQNAWHIYVLRIDFQRIGKSRKQAVAELAARGIGTQVHYYPVPLQPYYRERFGFCDGQFPAAEKHAARALTIPLFPALADSDVERVVREMRHVLSVAA
jgi:UDP-4-amino-4,6-dideoxy-N-acetyl-beta-L-altrosamine transaminase